MAGRPPEALKQWCADMLTLHENEKALWQKSRLKYEEVLNDLLDYLENGERNSKIFYRHFAELGLVISRGDGLAAGAHDVYEECPGIGTKR